MWCLCASRASCGELFIFWIVELQGFLKTYWLSDTCVTLIQYGIWPECVWMDVTCCAVQESVRDVTYMSRYHQSCQFSDPYGRFMQHCHLSWWNSYFSPEGHLGSRTTALGYLSWAVQSSCYFHSWVRYNMVSLLFIPVSGTLKVGALLYDNRYSSNLYVRWPFSKRTLMPPVVPEENVCR